MADGKNPFEELVQPVGLVLRDWLPDTFSPWFAAETARKVLQILEGMGAERDTSLKRLGSEAKFNWQLEVDGPGTYLVMRLET